MRLVFIRLYTVGMYVYVCMCVYVCVCVCIYLYVMLYNLFVVNLKNGDSAVYKKKHVTGKCPKVFITISNNHTAD